MVHEGLADTAAKVGMIDCEPPEMRSYCMVCAPECDIVLSVCATCCSVLRGFDFVCKVLTVRLCGASFTIQLAQSVHGMPEGPHAPQVKAWRRVTFITPTLHPWFSACEDLCLCLVSF
eukprot:COSAG02_NODE_3151_length_7275_cov_3.804905_5_plen_118_part_00